MGRPLYTNNAASALAAGITSTQTTIQVQDGMGNLFPTPVGGDYFYVTVTSISLGGAFEIMQCTARSGDTMTVIRGVEGTSAQAFNIGDNVQLRITAAGMNFLTGQAVTSTEEEAQTATQGQTVFTLVNFDYSPGTNNLAVFVNGSKQVSGVNYSETNVNTITFNTGLNVGDIVEFLVGISVASGTLFANDVQYNEGGTGAVTRTLESKLQESVSVKDFGAKGDGVTDDTIAIQDALNTGKLIYAPQGTYKITSALTITSGGIYGDGSLTVFQRAFTGGRLIGYPSGGAFILRDFAITTKTGITVANGDTGIDIGYTSWSGAGDINNLTITGQWDGFKWSGGTMNVINNIQSISNKGHGFYSINGRGPLNNCLAQYNYGDGYHYYSNNGSQTGFTAANCGSFGNQGYGWYFGGSVGSGNIYLIQSGSSNDGKGGVLFQQQYTMCFFNQMLIEGAGNAYLTPGGISQGFIQYTNAQGFAVVPPNPSSSPCDSFFLTDCFINQNNGTGMYLAGLTNSHFNNVSIFDSGIGGLGGGNAVGLNLINNNANLQFNNLISLPAGSTQTYDIAISTTSNLQINFGIVNFNTIYNPSYVPIVFTVPANNPVASTSVASVSVLILPDWLNFITITGTTNINFIIASWNGRQVTLKFAGILSVANGNNIYLNGSSFTTAADSTLTLVCDGTNWYELSRTNDR